MTKRSSTRGPKKAVEEALQAMLFGFKEVINNGGGDDNEKFLSDASFNALLCAFKSAKPHMGKKAVAEFVAGVLLIVDMEKVKKREGNYHESYESFFEVLTS